MVNIRDVPLIPSQLYFGHLWFPALRQSGQMFPLVWNVVYSSKYVPEFGDWIENVILGLSTGVVIPVLTTLAVIGNFCSCSILNGS